MRLSEFILKNMEVILKEWENFARKIQPTDRRMEVKELRDHAEDMLKTIAADLATKQTETERVEKAEGDKPKLDEETAAEIHADARWQSGFPIDLLIAEYRALRASVLHLWLEESLCNSHEETGDLMRFNEAIDQSLAESVTRYSQTVMSAQDVFLGTLGHDLRSPLNSLGLSAQLLMHTETDGRLAQLGSRMFNSVLRMKQMLDNLLEFTQGRIGAGININLAETDLAPISEQVVEEFRASNPERIIRNIITGPCKGDWDAGRISRVYQNLIGNALQYGVSNRDVVVTSYANENEAIISVHNEGEPIPTNEQERIFEILQRAAQPNESDNNANMGLGLYIVKEIITAHQGTISVASTETEGTTFTVRLPIKSLQENKAN
jgi:signal transduction histidine kinase